MYRSSYYFLFALIAVLLLGLIFGGNDHSETVDQQKVLPVAVSTRLDEIKKISVTAQNGTVVLTRESNGWVVPARRNYRADDSKVVKLLRDLKDARLLEAKTKKPENHSDLGVGKLATLVVLDDDFSLFLGNQASGRSGRYMRYADSDQVWLQSALMADLSGNPGWWLQNDLLDIPAEEISTIRIIHPDETLSARRSEAGEVLIDDVDKDSLRYAGVEDSLFNMLTSVQLQDVAPIADIDWTDAVQLEIGLVNGEDLSLKLVRREDRHWLMFDAVGGGVNVSDVTLAFEISRLDYDDMSKTKNAFVKAS